MPAGVGAAGRAAGRARPGDCAAAAGCCAVTAQTSARKRCSRVRTGGWTDRRCRVAIQPPCPVGAAGSVWTDVHAVRPVIAGCLGAALLAGAVPARAEPDWTEALHLAHRSHRAPRPGVPSVVVHAPAGFDASVGLDLVVLLHGWSCCAAGMVGASGCAPDDPNANGWRLAGAHDRAGKNSLLVVPQLAFFERSSSPGRFSQPGFFRGFLRELLEDGLVSRLGGSRRVEDVASVTLVAHSAGFATVLAILAAGNVPVDNVVLLDALYAGEDRFVAWMEAPSDRRPRRIVSIHTAARTTTARSRRLARRLRARLGPARVAVDPPSLAEAIDAHRAVVAQTSVGHGAVPAAHLASVLRGLPLRDR